MDDCCEEQLCLGIDLGTTSVKVCLVNIATRAGKFSTTEPTLADLQSDIGALGAEQDFGKILQALHACLNRITDRNRSHVKCISVAGQMHGVMLWNGENEIRMENNEFVSMEMSSLYTWQDHRCTEQFLFSLPKSNSHIHLSSGFGCCTLFWLARYQPEILARFGYTCAGSITDFVVAMLCGQNQPVMTDQMAASWGYFDTTDSTWNLDILRDSGFPVHLLPWIIKSGSIAGTLQQEWCGIAPGTPVLAGLGDLQCAIVSSIKGDRDAVLNISTSCQLAFPVHHANFVPPSFDKPGPVSYFPYFDGGYLAVAASLNGGNVLTQFVRMLKQWLCVFDVDVTEETIWSKLDKLTIDNTTTSGLQILPAIFGERHNTDLRGSASGLNESNLSLDSIFRSVSEGLINNLHMMMPCSFLIENGVEKIITSGSVFDKNIFVKDHVERLFGAHISVVHGQSMDSAFGAALVGCRVIRAKPET